MSKVHVERIESANPGALTVLERIEKKFDDIRRRAFELFEKRGAQNGKDLDDWFQAEREILESPATQLAENDQAYELDVALPGIEPNEVEVSAALGEIIVHAASETEKKGKDGTVVWSEFGSREYFRRLPVSGQIDLEKVTAKLEKGVLHVTAPKAAAPGKPASGEKTVSVQAA